MRALCPPKLISPPLVMETNSYLVTVSFPLWVVFNLALHQFWLEAQFVEIRFEKEY